MTHFLLVCLAGAIGTGARFAMLTGVSAIFGSQFPYGTIAVNVLGSFLIGFLVAVSAATDLVPPPLRIVLATGFLGGFTTYSAFNNETVLFLQNDLWGRALANVVVTLVVCLCAGFAGVACARRLVGA
jgi:CrcB protein